MRLANTSREAHPLVELGGETHDVPQRGGTQNVEKIASHSSEVDIILFHETILHQSWNMLQPSFESQWTGRYLDGITTNIHAKTSTQRISFLMRIV
jgi:hypothetical protein